MKILALNGSPNKNGCTAFLLNTVLESAKEVGAEVELEHVQDAILECSTPFCVACSTPCNRSCYAGTGVERLFEKMCAADAIVVGSPSYFGTVSAQIKALFDKSRDLRGKRALIGKLGAAVSVGASKYGGQQTTQRAIHDMMLVQGMTIVGDSADFDDLRVPMGHQGVGAQSPAAEDKYAVKRAQAMGLQLVKLLG
ncbi:MAG: flavodoxin family protein [Oscillospiraceae bacterium]|nr:flavodoxin family protein [Oscillospiraceae bacterium]